jgi:type I restriction enzyme M protein
MLGTIIGDTVGSIWEFHPTKSKDFEFLSDKNFFTDDSVMTLAIAKSLTECKEDYSDLQEITIRNMRELGMKYPDAGYGRMFGCWIMSDNPHPYYSCGNGSAMRVSPCGEVAKSIEEAKLLAKLVTEITHNHPEGLKGAEATAVAVYMAKNGKSINEIKQYINDNYYSMNFSIDEIRKSYHFDGTCQGTVPQALMSFFDAKDYEDCIRNAISIGGDADTLGAIAGTIAEYHFGIPEDLRNKGLKYLTPDLLQIYTDYCNKYGFKI